LLSFNERALSEYGPEGLDEPEAVAKLLNELECSKQRERKRRDTTMRPKPIHVSKIKGKVHAAIITVR
jgi:hypothetical protein